MKDPTANAAARNVTALQRAACITSRDEHGPYRIWMDLATWRHLQGMVRVITDDTGERHIRFPEVKR